MEEELTFSINQYTIPAKGLFRIPRNKGRYYFVPGRSDIYSHHVCQKVLSYSHPENLTWSRKHQPSCGHRHIIWTLGCKGHHAAAIDYQFTEQFTNIIPLCWQNNLLRTDIWETESSIATLRTWFCVSIQLAALASSQVPCETPVKLNLIEIYLAQRILAYPSAETPFDMRG